MVQSKMMSNFIVYFVLLVILGFLDQNGNHCVCAVPFSHSNNFYQTVNNLTIITNDDQNHSTNNNDCLSDRLVVYKVVFHTYWTRELFPKHYPDWRPPAQWTKTIGKSLKYTNSY